LFLGAPHFGRYCPPPLPPQPSLSTVIASFVRRIIAWCAPLCWHHHPCRLAVAIAGNRHKGLWVPSPLMKWRGQRVDRALPPSVMGLWGVRVDELTGKYRLWSDSCPEVWYSLSSSGSKNKVHVGKR
jgi:hypothetical protein